MTRDEVIAMALRCGARPVGMGQISLPNNESIINFATAIAIAAKAAADEREACLKIVCKNDIVKAVRAIRARSTKSTVEENA